MKKTSFPAYWFSIPLLVFVLSALPVRAEETAPAAAGGVKHAEVEQAYRQVIEKMESADGAYAEGLSESLLSLAETLQHQGRHDEAIDVFKRGTHLARINGGLYCEQQIPLVEGEIGSHVATGNYQLADQRQRYLARVQLRSLPSGQSLTNALMKQGNWQFQAYRVGLEAQGYTRLMSMWDFYQRALEDVIAREGETSSNLLPPLYGMLQAQYLISSYALEDPIPSFGEDVRIDPDLMRFKRYRAQSYRLGNAVISDIYDVEQEHSGQDKRTLAETLVMLGDWRLWNGDIEGAWQAYRDAETELAQQKDAQPYREQLFGEPVPLPDFAGLSPLPKPVAPDQADILVEFDVSERGRVNNLERVDEDDDDFASQARRIMRTLRRTKFRPRFEAGEPVETEKLVKAFSIQ